MTTIRELSEQLGVSAQTIRRYVKQELGVATKERQMLQLDANQAALVADHFTRSKSKKEEPATNRVAELEQDVAVLRERVAGLEQQISILKTQLEAANAALEREQQSHVGFWARLGQRLLGSGARE